MNYIDRVQHKNYVYLCLRLDVDAAWMHFTIQTDAQQRKQKENARKMSNEPNASAQEETYAS